MNICSASRNIWTLIVAAILLVTLALAPRAKADDIDPDADVPDASTLPESSPPDQVLEIPQQCDQDAVAALCDRTPTTADSDDDSSTPVAASDPDETDPAADPSINTADVGTLSDYTNQNAAIEASAAGTMSVPVGFYPPVLAPAPVVVSSGALAPGPGAYSQWAGGPGTYQQWAHGPGMYRMPNFGPGYIPRMPMGYHASLGHFGPRPFSFGGGHFGRR